MESPVILRSTLTGAWKRYTEPPSRLRPELPTESTPFEEVAEQVLQAVSGALMIPDQEAVLVVDREGRVRIANQQACELFEFLRKGPPNDEPISVISEGLVSPGRLEDLIQGKAMERYETVYSDLQGRKVHLDIFLSAVENQTGQAVGFVFVARDVTGRKKQEKALREATEKLRQMKQELLHFERLASIGRFTSGIVHEIKNTLGIILGGIQYIGSGLSGADEEVRNTVGIVKETTVRMGELVQEILQFSKPTPPLMERVAAEALVTQTLPLMKYVGIHKKKGFSLETEFREREIWVRVDRRQMQQVIFNLLINAVDALPHGGTICARVYSQPPTADFSGKGACVIEVSDTAGGIPKEEMGHLFKPFFTTKGPQGVGLGLVVCKMIVENHQGRLRIESEQGRGTTVSILLPRTE